MEKRFPHMGNQGFPGVGNVDVYAYSNTFDYRRWQPDVKLKLCNVPWCSTYDNVPGFESAEERDAWFDGIDGRAVELASETHLLPDGSVKLPLPFDVLSMYNYIAVEFPAPTSADEPLAYEGLPHRLRWYFFVTDVRSIAGSTTEAVLQRDDWTTFFHDCSISYMMLERGHYPVATTSADDYLANPIAGNGLLLAPDVSFGDARNVASAGRVVWNDGPIWACIATYADAAGDWGTWQGADVPSATALTPALAMASAQGVPGAAVVALPAEGLAGFLGAVEQRAPQFKQTVLGMFLAPEKLLELGASFEFCGCALRSVGSRQTAFPLVELDKQAFGFPERYASLAKLYTYPYSHIEIASESGVLATVRVEDTDGRIDARAALSLAWPAVSLDCVLTGINGRAASVSFRTLEERTFAFGGDWYRTVASWDVPTFAVSLDGGTAYDVSSEYSRAQRGAAAETAYANALRGSAVTTDNTALQIAANVAMTETSNTASSTDTYYGNQLNQALQAWNAGYSRNCQALDADAETQQSAVSIGAGAIGAATSAVTNALSGNIAGAVASAISGVSSGVSTAASTAISINLASSKVEAGVSNSQAQVTSTNTNNTQRTAIQTDCVTANMVTQNQASSAMAANAVGAANASAAALRSLEYGGIANARRQGRLGAPAVYGSASPGTAATRPMMLSANVVTQPRGCIAAAGDAFLRYGYALGQQVDASKINLMKHFTFWKASDVWCVGANGVPEDAQEMVKSIFINGTTVWRDPDEIGRVSIYDNI